MKKVLTELSMTLSKRFPFNGNRKMNGEKESGNYVLKIIKMLPYFFLMEIILLKEKSRRKRKEE